jgi:hypothetical protein
MRKLAVVRLGGLQGNRTGAMGKRQALRVVLSTEGLNNEPGASWRGGSSFAQNVLLHHPLMGRVVNKRPEPR